MKILHIDDNEDLLMPLEMLFKSKGWDYSTGIGGKKGLELLKENNYDLVLLDLTMPEFSGYDVMDQLEKEELTQKQKIVVFTANSLSDSELLVLKKQGVHDILRKPIDISELEKQLILLENSHIC